MFIYTYRRAWIRGFIDGERGQPHSTQKGIPGFRYTNGWIEGHAKRHGHAYGLGDISEDELEKAREKTPVPQTHAWDTVSWLR